MKAAYIDQVGPARNMIRYGELPEPTVVGLQR